MNAAAKALHQGTLVGSNVFRLTKQTLLILFVLGLVLASGLAIVYVKDYNRSLCVHLNTLEKEQHVLEITRDQLLLEESTLSSQARVEAMAARQGMLHPMQQNAVVLD